MSDVVPLTLITACSERLPALHIAASTPLTAAVIPLATATASPTPTPSTPAPLHAHAKQSALAIQPSRPLLKPVMDAATAAAAPPVDRNARNPPRPPARNDVFPLCASAPLVQPVVLYSGAPPSRSHAPNTRRNAKIRLHMPAIPHTITTDEYSHCAFTGKVKRFAPMMHTVTDAAGERVYEVYHYGVEGSESGADVEVCLFSQAEWRQLRVESFRAKYPQRDVRLLDDPTAFVGELADMGCVLYQRFNERLRTALQTHYRGKETDIMCIPFGPAHQAALFGLDLLCVETGIGYDNPYTKYRVYESDAWRHVHLGREQSLGDTRLHWFTVPNYFSVAAAWPPLPHVAAPRPLIGFLGRIYGGKGVDTICAVARACPQYDFVICGQGDPKRYLSAALPNLRYEPPLHGGARARYFASLTALLCPSTYIEPFCGVAVEAQIMGTAVIAPACGAFLETVVHGETGWLCNTLSDYIQGVHKAVGGAFDRERVRARAVSKYDLPVVAQQFHRVFDIVMAMEGGTR